MDSPCRRRHERRPITAPGQVRRAYVRQPMQVDDLSVSGCQSTMYDRVEPGERLFVSLPGLSPQEAECRWYDGWTAGFAFAKPMHPAVADHVADGHPRGPWKTR